MLTPEKIEELRALLAKATPGPWGQHLVDDTTIIAENGFEIGSTWPDGGIDDDRDFSAPVEQHEINAALIVAMRNALPALLDLAPKALATLSLAGEDGTTVSAETLCAKLDQRAIFARQEGTATGIADAIHFEQSAALIRSLTLRVEAEKRAREEVERELSEERLWSSRYCVEDYEVRNAIGERFCLVPPDGGDVKTWEAAAEMRKTLEAAETHSAALARALEDVSAKVDAFWNDPERPSVHRMRSKSVHELSDAQRRARSLLAPKEDTDAE